MRRAGSAIVGLLMLPAVAWADREVWFNPKMGCGRASQFAKTGKMEDLPGCTGSLPKDAPKIETMLSETKKKLIDAEEYLEKNKLDKVDPILAAVESDIAKAPTIHPEIPDRWEQAHTAFTTAIASLRARRKLAPYTEKLKTNWAAAMEANTAKNRADVEGGPAEAIKLSQACAVTFAEARTAGVDFATEIDFGKDRKRLDAALAECEQVRKTAEPLAKAQEKLLKEKQKREAKAAKAAAAAAKKKKKSARK